MRPLNNEVLEQQLTFVAQVLLLAVWQGATAAYCCTLPELCVTALVQLPSSLLRHLQPRIFNLYMLHLMAHLMHPCRLLTHSKAAGRARPFPRHFPSSSAVAARTLRLCRRSRGVVRNTQQAQEPVLPENLDLNDPELQAQITALLKELDPDLLLVREEPSAFQR